MTMKRFWTRPQAIVLGLMVALAVSGYTLAVSEHTGSPVVDVQVAPADNGNHAGFAPVVKKVLPTVVSIRLHC